MDRVYSDVTIQHYKVFVWLVVGEINSNPRLHEHAFFRLYHVSRLSFD